MSFNQITASTIDVAGVSISAIPPWASATGSVVDITDNHPLNNVLGYVASQNTMILGAGSSGGNVPPAPVGFDTGLVIGNSSVTAQPLYISNSSPDGLTALAGAGFVAAVDTTNNSGILANVAGMSLVILGDAGSAGAVLTARGDGTCYWAGGAGPSRLMATRELSLSEGPPNIEALKTQIATLQAALAAAFRPPSV
jgi:hypothetical protein